MKKVVVIILLIVLGMRLLSIPKEENISSKPTIKIGVSLPLTGSMSEAGRSYRNSAQMRIEELNNENTKYKYEIIFEDDAFEAKKEIMIARKLINVDKVDVLITSAAGSGYSIASLADEKHVIYFDFTWGDDIVESSNYTFNYFTQPCDLSVKLVKKAHDLGYRNISTLTLNHSGTIFSTNCFKNEIKKYPDMKIIDEEIVDYTTGDFTLLVKKMDNKKPDAYFTELYGYPLINWGKELKLQNIKTPIIATNAFKMCSPEELRIFEGAVMSGDARASEEFLNKYTNKYNSNPGASVNYYDIVDLISQTYESYDKKPSPEKVKESLLSMGEFLGQDGLATIDEDGRFRNEPTMTIVHDGKVELLERKD